MVLIWWEVIRNSLFIHPCFNFIYIHYSSLPWWLKILLTVETKIPCSTLVGNYLAISFLFTPVLIWHASTTPHHWRGKSYPHLKLFCFLGRWEICWHSAFYSPLIFTPVLIWYTYIHHSSLPWRGKSYPHLNLFLCSWSVGNLLALSFLFTPVFHPCLIWYKLTSPTPHSLEEENLVHAWNFFCVSLISFLFTPV